MQVHFRNYKNDLLSFQHNIMNLGMHTPGRYAGYDTVKLDTQIPMRLNVDHSNSNIHYKNVNGNSFGPYGVILTAQGSIIFEDTGLSFDIDTNAGNMQTRYDLIIATHLYTVIVGGQDATYSVIKGPVNNRTIPQLQDPAHQIIIGIIELPPNAGSISDCYYVKYRAPDSGDELDARIAQANFFKATQLFNKSATPLILRGPFTEDFSSNLWSMEEDGNFFELLPVQPNPATPNKYYLGYLVAGLRLKHHLPQEGTEVRIKANFLVSFLDNEIINQDALDIGYRGLTIAPDFINFQNFRGSIVRGMNRDIPWVYHFIFDNGRWLLLNIENQDRFSPAVQQGYNTNITNINNNITNLIDRVTFLDTELVADGTLTVDNTPLQFDRNRMYSYLTFTDRFRAANFQFDLAGAKIGAEVKVLFSAPDTSPFNVTAVNGASRVVLIELSGNMTAAPAGNLSQTYILNAKYIGKAPNSDMYITYKIEKVTLHV